MTGISWGAFLMVLLVSLVSAVGAVALFAVGVRLLATPGPGSSSDGAETGPDDPGEDDPTTPTATRPRIATAGAGIAFLLAAAVAVYGVVLIVR